MQPSKLYLILREVEMSKEEEKTDKKDKTVLEKLKEFFKFHFGQGSDYLGKTTADQMKKNIERKK